MVMKRADETDQAYIGDGVYASFDGYQVWLRTPRENGEHEIALEPNVYLKLVEYVTRLRNKVEQTQSPE